MSDVPSVPAPAGLSPMPARQAGSTPVATMQTPTTAFLAGIGQSPLAFQMGTYPTPNTAQQLMNMPTGGVGSALAPPSASRTGVPSSTSPFPFPFPFQSQPNPGRLRAPSTSGSVKGQAGQTSVNIDDVVRVLGEVVKELERIERVWGEWEQVRSQAPSFAPEAQRADCECTLRPRLTPVLLQDCELALE